MTSPAGQSAELKALARRQVTVLQIAEATCRYAAAQLGNGTSPAEARQTALFVAGELETVAGALRRLALARLDPAERRALAAELVEAGMSQQQVADRLGRSRRTVRGYLGSGSGRLARLA